MSPVPQEYIETTSNYTPPPGHCFQTQLKETFNSWLSNDGLYLNVPDEYLESDCRTKTILNFIFIRYCSSHSDFIPNVRFDELSTYPRPNQKLSDIIRELTI